MSWRHELSGAMHIVAWREGCDEIWFAPDSFGRVGTILWSGDLGVDFAALRAAAEAARPRKDLRSPERLACCEAIAAALNAQKVLPYWSAS